MLHQIWLCAGACHVPHKSTSNRCRFCMQKPTAGTDDMAFYKCIYKCHSVSANGNRCDHTTSAQVVQGGSHFCHCWFSNVCVFCSVVAFDTPGATNRARAANLLAL